MGQPQVSNQIRFFCGKEKKMQYVLKRKICILMEKCAKYICSYLRQPSLWFIWTCLMFWTILDHIVSLQLLFCTYYVNILYVNARFQYMHRKEMQDLELLTFLPLNTFLFWPFLTFTTLFYPLVDGWTGGQGDTHTRMDGWTDRRNLSLCLQKKRTNIQPSYSIIILDTFTCNCICISIGKPCM